jgi:hypothetical protein
MAEQIFKLLVAGALTIAGLFFFGMVECQLRSWRYRAREIRDVLKHKRLVKRRTTGPVQGYDSPEIFQQDEMVRRKTDLDEN